MGFPDWENVPRPHGDISRVGILKMDSPSRVACAGDPKLLIGGGARGAVGPMGSMIRL